MIKEITDYLCKLININTITNQYNEIEAALYIKNIFDKLDIENKIYEPISGKGSIYAIIPGETNKSIVLHSHLDTADYDTEKWSFPPGKSTIFNNCIVGRGSLDCKGLCAIWMAIMNNISKNKKIPKKSLIFLSSADEENGGHFGSEYILNNTDLLSNAELVIGEGGGYPISLGEDIYYTFQTGEIYPELKTTNSSIGNSYTSNSSIDKKYSDYEISKIFDKAIKYQYYNENTSFFYKNRHLQNKRKIESESFYKNIDLLLDHNNNFNNKKLFKLFDSEIKTINPNYKILPVISPGYSDNRFFRINNIQTVGFFPLDIKNNISGIHGENEYISLKSLKIAYNLLYRVILELIY